MEITAIIQKERWCVGNIVSGLCYNPLFLIMYIFMELLKLKVA
jgi:hypothetical protein